MPKDLEDTNSNTQGMDAFAELFILSGQMRQARKGTMWTEDELRREIENYFLWCARKDVKQANVGLSLWLSCGKGTLYTWASDPVKYGAISVLTSQALEAIEHQYINRVEKYPTGNIFLLKTSHGHVETSKVDITSNGKEITNQENVEDLVSRLGLDKK
jgi:hypothetical protein